MKFLIFASTLLFSLTGFAGTEDGSGIRSFREVMFMQSDEGDSFVQYALANDEEVQIYTEEVEVLEEEQPELLQKIEDSYNDNSSWQEI